MDCEYLVVIGTERDDSPLAGVLAAIGKGLGKVVRIYLVADQRSREWEGQSFQPSTELAGQALAALDGRAARLLLFEASTVEKPFNPLSGLLVWQALYHRQYPGAKKQCVWLDCVLDFFTLDSPAVWWSGLVLPVGDLSVTALAGPTWEREMKSLAHDAGRRA